MAGQKRVFALDDPAIHALLAEGLQDVDARIADKAYAVCARQSAKAGHDDVAAGQSAYEFFSPDISGPNNSQLSSLNRIICNCSSGAKSVGLVLILVPGR